VLANHHKFRVIYGDTDQMGVVYYANYLRYFEAGRTEIMRALEIPYRELEDEGVLLPVSRATVDYHSPARYDDELTLETRIENVRKASVRIGYELVRESDGKVIATGETQHACIDRDGRVTRMPANLRDRLIGQE
jgi:acyl-CoA thioester hydrolase